MQTCLIRLTVLTAAVTVIILNPASAADTGGYDHPVGFHQEVQWATSRSSARGLMFWEHSAPGAVRRVLIETPAGDHLVLTRALLVREGIDHEELRHEESGWTAELTVVRDFRARSLSEYFAGAFDEDAPNAGGEIELALQTSNGISFSAHVPNEAQSWQEHATFAGLLAAQLRAEAISDLPEDVAEALTFLDAAFEPADARGIIEVMAGAFELHAGGEEASWRQIEGRPTPGVGLVEAESITFASEFSSVDPMAPLAPGTVDRLAQDERWAEPSGR